MDDTTLRQFQDTVWHYYDQHGRHDLPWRLPEANGTFDPYKVLVSELMLQQTQVNRVLPKYHQFLAAFPNVATLAQATLGEVLIAWSGLGYNRRAKFLWQAAHYIQDEWDGAFSETVEDLLRLPGVGKNTAGAILAYAYNRPVVFIETNIRSVYIHHFFAVQAAVTDTEIAAVVAATLPSSEVRTWYWALMDYGSYLKQTVGNAARKSTSYQKQAPFHGSKRQIRGEVLRRLTQGPLTEAALLDALADSRAPQVLADLVTEQMIRFDGEQYVLA